MIGNLNKKTILSLLCVSLFISCGNIETEKGDGLFENDSGRYTVVERKINVHKGFYRGDYSHEYYLLDTKTGDLSKIDFEEIE